MKKKLMLDVEQEFHIVFLLIVAESLPASEL
jgi:hypothetical protein